MAKIKIPGDPNLGKNLKTLMGRHGSRHTQTELSQKVGISQSSVGRILRGEVNPSAAALNRISELFGVNLEDLYLNPEKFDELHGDPLNKAIRGLTRAIDVEVERARTNRMPLLKWDQLDEPVDGESVPWMICPVDMQTRGYVVEVQGVSMTDPMSSTSFREGDFAFIEPTGSAPAGSFVIAKIGTRPAALRQLIIEGDSWMLVALNQTWPERIVRFDVGSDRLLGIVRATLRILPPAKAA